MIRASNLPVLLAIALYERQQYNELSLMETISDFIEKYIGSIPRRLKQAAGFDNFGSRHDISLVFEIEREVGTFYRDSEDDEDEVHLPPSFEDDEATTGTSITLPDSAPFTASPAKGSFSPARPSFTQSGSSGPPAPQHVAGAHRRRNSSVYEPSPLARLFVTQPDGQDARPRRQSMRASDGSSSAMVTSYSISPSQSGGIAARRQQSRNQPYAPRVQASPSIPTIRESSPLGSPTRTRRPFPSGATTPPNVPPAAKASDVGKIEESEALGEARMAEQLNRMDERQKRIEEMLSRMVGEPRETQRKKPKPT